MPVSLLFKQTKTSVRSNLVRLQEDVT